MVTIASRHLNSEQADLQEGGAAIKALKRNACLYLKGSLLAALDPYVEYPSLQRPRRGRWGVCRRRSPILSLSSSRPESHLFL